MAGIVITGAAGFIGAHCCAALTRRGHDVTGVDNFNAYYTPALKQARVEHLAAQARVHDIDINDHTALTALLEQAESEKLSRVLADVRTQALGDDIIISGVPTWAAVPA